MLQTLFFAQFSSTKVAYDVTVTVHHSYYVTSTQLVKGVLRQTQNGFPSLPLDNHTSICKAENI